ncbi:MAG: HD domain-containing protein [Methanothrix sp.]|nr:HD domain-containing protein [Methanothrix sp.]
MCSRNSFHIKSVLSEIQTMYKDADPAHDFSHIMRVYNNAQIIGEKEGADMEVLLLAALLHDAGDGSKLSDRTQSQRSRIVDDFLRKIGHSMEVRQKVLYAVDAHRFSKGIVPATMEAKILQDADRLDAMGAIGIARVFTTGGTLGRALYNPDDPFCRTREPDDKKWNLDHFFKKLLKLQSGMHTKTARELASRRAEVLKRYLSDLEREIGEVNAL